MSLTKPTRTRETRGGRETTKRTRNGHGRSRTRASDARDVKSGKNGKGGTRRFTDGNNERGMYAVLDEEELAGKLNQLSLAAAGVDLDGVHGGHGHAHGIAISPINREYISEMEDLEDM